MDIVTILEKGSGSTLAKAEVGANLASYEGNWYFDPSAVEQGSLQLTDRTYTCPYKGTCHWVDFRGPDGEVVRDVSWVYQAPKPGHELIRGRYGFYQGARGATRQEG